ncbi:hypothetical protein EI53_02114 [Fusobacterium naviforme]|nr:hypothetical protein EI53_02114 [Fusobacterium naviforme]STO26934.1 Uncharacterised protein [Fusobacterium naviforme]
MCTVFYSTNSHRKIVHLSHCSIFRHIPKDNRRSFSSLEEAQEHGYRLCNCCPSVAQKYRKGRKQVDDFCRQHGLSFKLFNGVIHVISRHDCWRIIVNGNNHTLFLYHKNTEKRFFKDPHPSIIPGYHSQAYRSKTILGYLEYIVSHDEYRDEHPCTEKAAPEAVPVYSAPSWVADKYGADYPRSASRHYRRIMGTKKYRNAQAKKKRQERRAAIIRVNALLDELAAIGY